MIVGHNHTNGHVVRPDFIKNSWTFEKSENLKTSFTAMILNQMGMGKIIGNNIKSHINVLVMFFKKASKINEN